MGYTWQFALTAVFIEGIIFIILTVTKVRQWIVDAIPLPLKHAIGAGIGLFIDMFDTMGTVIGVSQKAGFVDENGKVDGLDRIFMADAVGTIAGACLGTSTTTTYVESSAGVGAGGRTGLTAFSAGLQSVPRIRSIRHS